ncbi:hypothetical protein BDM02DRAFT_3122406, partial [Thelephora ganbajun]
IDPSSLVSNISPSVVDAPNLSRTFKESGYLTCTTTLAIPTTDGCRYSHLRFMAG